MKSVYAVIDTNVILSAFITKDRYSPTVKVLYAVLDGIIVPLYHDDIMAEYGDVLRREKFHLAEEKITFVLNHIAEVGRKVEPTPTGKILIDPDDLIFYEVVLEKREENAYLITGNLKHYPVEQLSLPRRKWRSCWGCKRGDTFFFLAFILKEVYNGTKRRQRRVHNKQGVDRDEKSIGVFVGGAAGDRVPAGQDRRGHNNKKRHLRRGRRRQQPDLDA